jgi:hypothetical protein
MALPTIIEEVERSIYEAIRLIAVAEGYTPDIMGFSNNPLDYAQYQAQLASIKNNVGFAIELFNNSQPEQKGEITTSRISLAHGSTLMGEIGLPVQKDYRDYGNQSGLVVGTTLTNHYEYDVYITARNLKEFRICQGIVLSALPSRSWLKFYTPQIGDKFLNIMSTGWESPSELRGVKEFIYTYEIPDLLLSPYIEVEILPNILQIDAQLQTYLGITH